MKKIIILLIFLTSLCKAQQFKNIFFGKSNTVVIGKKGYIERDKFLHSTIGGFVGSSVYMYSYYKTDKIFLSSLLSILASFAIGESKELYDRRIGRKFSNNDLIATTFGGFTGVFTKIIQIDIQQKNKITSKEYKHEFQNLSISFN